jgi:hypothetical protein
MTYDLPIGTYQETYNSISFLFPFSLTGTTIEMKVFTIGKSVIAEYSTLDKLEIDANESTRLRIKTHDVTINPGNYTYKIKITRDGIKKTYLSGNWSITD